MNGLTLGQLRELTKNLPDDFTIEITATTGFNPFLIWKTWLMFQLTLVILIK